MKSDWETLIHAYLDGTIDAEQLRDLNERLLADAGARRVFSELLNVDSALGDLAAGCPVEMPAAGGSKSGRMRSMPLRWVGAAAAGIVFAVGAGWWPGGDRSYATVERAAGTNGLSDGAVLRGGRYEIEAGSVALVTTRGARIVIEAPAEFSFVSAQRLRLTRGRLAAEVPPSAKGFTVVTPSGDAVDLGTRFGVDVMGGGATEVHVFEGEVVAKASGSPTRQSVRDGQAVTLERGVNVSRDLRSAAFIQLDEIGGLQAGLVAGQRSKAEAAMEQLRRDPDLIALHDFESDEQLPGTFRLVQGRWPGSRAPEFVNEGDHLKLDAGGDREWPQLTLAAWVRLDRLGAPFQSLLHTDGWSEDRKGQVHWMVTRLNTMRLALRGNTLAPGAVEADGFPDSRTSVLPEQGRWVHLVTVYDAPAGMVRFYLNGRLDSETRQALAHPARLGAARIGNWDRQDRRLSGRVDELMLLGRAMDDREIRALFEAGNPYR
ncbi:MAG: FecR domain-containing protein [Verrucomicrobiales bacterium]|nr:FecR domain-containing protein [Verrucomicrobiales bacterium]